MNIVLASCPLKVIVATRTQHMAGKKDLSLPMS